MKKSQIKKFASTILTLSVSLSLLPRNIDAEENRTRKQMKMSTAMEYMETNSSNVFSKEDVQIPVSLLNSKNSLSALITPESMEYELTVEKGQFQIEGENKFFSSKKVPAGKQVTLTPYNLSNQKFKEWRMTGNRDVLLNASKEHLTFIMPNRNVTIEALYQQLPPNTVFNITIIGGTADIFSAMPGDTIHIRANNPKRGKRFKEWKVLKGELQLFDEKSSPTSFMMIADHVKIEAIFEENFQSPQQPQSPEPSSPTKHRVTINGGIFKVQGLPSGDQMVERGKIVTIQAENPKNKHFDKWTLQRGDVVLADYTQPITTFVMSDKEVELTAVFKDKPQTSALSTASSK